MHPVLRAVKQGLAYAKFENSEIKDATLKLIDDIGIDLDSNNNDWEQPTHIDEGVVTLEHAISNYDASQEAINDVIDKSKSDPVEED